MVLESNSVNVKFYNISEDKILELKALEDKNPTELTLVIVKNSFSGNEIISLIIETVSAFVGILGLIHSWKGSNDIKIEKEDKDVAAKKVKVTIASIPDGEIRIELEDVSESAYKELMKILH